MQRSVPSGTTSPVRASCLFLAALLFSTPAAEPLFSQEPSLLTYGITGSVDNTPPELLPWDILDHVDVQRALLAVAAAPRNHHFLDSALSSSNVTVAILERSGMLRANGANNVLAFTLLSRQDVARVRQFVEPLARSLAASYLAHRTQFDSIFAAYPLTTVDRRAIAFATVGCFSLDWDGLRTTADHGYRARTLTRPWGASYLIWAEERGGSSLEGVYWGSHYTKYGSTVLTTFGDHFTLPRDGFPDLGGRLVQPGTTSDLRDSALRNAAQAVALDAGDQIGREVGAVMLALRDGDRTDAEIARISSLDSAAALHLVTLLEATHYVARRGDRIAAIVPVLSDRDSTMVRGAMRLSREIYSTWLAANYPTVAAQLQDLAPVRQGVPFPEVFTQIWHYIFGLTNRELVRSGFFVDPYDPARPAKGFIPFVWTAGLVDTP